MFFGVISPRIASSTCCRRQRLRSAHGDRALRVLLADDVAVELGDDLRGVIARLTAASRSEWFWFV
jgi:hypothetical protein